MQIWWKLLYIFGINMYQHGIQKNFAGYKKRVGRNTELFSAIQNVLLGTVSAEKRILVKYSVSLGPLVILKYADHS